MPVKDSVYGEPDGELLEDNQDIMSATFRGIIDLLGKSANGQKGVAENALNAIEYRKYLEGKDFKFNPEVDPNRAFHTFTYPEIPRSALEVIQMLQNESESLSGTKAFSSGISGNALGDSVGGIRSALDATTKRQMGILRRLSNGLVKMARMMISMNAVWLSEEEIVRISDEKYETIPRSSLAGKYDLNLSISTPEVDEAQSQKLAFLLQTLGNKVPFEFTQMLIADIMRLDKRHTLAKMIENYQPQENPVEAKLKELDVMMQEAKIANERAKARENEVDVMLKSAKTMFEEAKAKKASSEADMNDLDYVRKGQGIDHEQEMSKKVLEEENKANIAVLNKMDKESE